MRDHQPTDPKYDDADTPRPKWLGRVIVIAMVLIVLGVLNVGWLIMRPAPVDSAMKARLEADPLLAQGKSLTESSSCMSCHKVSSKAVGPSFVDVAARYKSRDDALAYVTGRILNGSAGEWGRVVMPRQPQLSEQDAQLMARWVLSQSAAGE